MNWKDCIIKGNKIKNVANGNKAAFYMSGVVNPTITLNTIDTAYRPITLSSADASNSKTADKAYPPTHTILDSNAENGVNITAMLNNDLIDMTNANQIVFYVGGKDKATSTEVKKYNYSAEHIRYTHPTATPKPTNTPTATPEVTHEPTATPDVTATPSPSASPDPANVPSDTETANNTETHDNSEVLSGTDTPIADNQ